MKDPLDPGTIDWVDEMPSKSIWIQRIKPTTKNVRHAHSDLNSELEPEAALAHCEREEK